MATKTLDTGKDKIQKICDDLRRETIEPAEREAAELVESAKKQAMEIIKQAEKEAADVEEAAHQRINKERSVFQSSMAQGIKQSMETLRQEIEGKLLSEGLGAAVAESSARPDLVAGLIGAVISAVEKEGSGTDLVALIPKSVSVDEVVGLLNARAKDLLKDGVRVGDFAGGMMLKLVDKQITIDLSDEAIKELLGRFVRKDYREVLFG